MPFILVEDGAMRKPEKNAGEWERKWVAVQLVLNTVLCQSNESEISLLFGTFLRNLTNFRTKLSADEIFAKHVAPKYYCTHKPSHKGVSCNICVQNFSTIVFFSLAS